ncbi:putative amino acid permease protein [Neofusicoccum parvum UCRNP2]|uniref:Putative amino acid permease protein n=1 Tax=Botryosphaeria parva (strain UCR-NP2) TaxID=1287680 RepID=R1EMP5_BOTPV|nr:putative amino acid permease protein [Neofusicoccum parvum UCRNP2]
MLPKKTYDSGDVEHQLETIRSVEQGEVMSIGNGKNQGTDKNTSREESGLKRNLAQRHLMMLAIGGVIGPGYFVGMVSWRTGCVSVNFWFVFLSFTFLGIYAFGEAEFWLSAAKLLFIAAFFLCAILISTGAIGGEKIGFKYYQDPGSFADGVKGVFKIFVFAALQYSGTEMVGITAGESADPARDVPKAIRTVFYRIVIIFVGGVFLLTITVPYNDPNLLSAGSKTARSPFVIAFTRAGAPVGAHLVNAVIVVTIFSAINGALYVGSRTLVGLAQQHQAPAIFRWTDKRGVPVPALVVTNAMGFLSLLNLASGSGAVYTWIISITGVSTFITWACICLCHIRFRQAIRKACSLVNIHVPFMVRFFRMKLK